MIFFNKLIPRRSTSARSAFNRPNARRSTSRGALVTCLLLASGLTNAACVRYVSAAFNGGGYAPPVPQGVFEETSPQAACNALFAHFVINAYPFSAGTTITGCDQSTTGVVVHWTGGNYYPAVVDGSCDAATPPSGPASSVGTVDMVIPSITAAEALEAFSWGFTAVLICYLTAWGCGQLLSMFDVRPPKS